eukprot:TRINITY_DN4271_c1_g1_i1.p1 TRINITY_DN4271_c1_g1~~TRINITY_DN4271_c1_g1_i1.p1  ORF type:complete len:210 (-),score=8.68 TRINITY_DN4271_c1_g1_i1:156-704(-)
MCVTFLYYGQCPVLLLLVAFNRDEFNNRQAQAVNQWQNNKDIIGGRDLQAGGTWLAVSKDGRVGILTNYREVVKAEAAYSRGRLIVDFLTHKQDPEIFAEKIDGQAYGGFNMIVGNPFEGKLVYTSNRNKHPIETIPSGTHGLSNGRLDDQWYKVQKGKKVHSSLKFCSFQPKIRCKEFSIK